MGLRLFLALLCVCSGLRAEEPLTSDVEEAIEIASEDFVPMEQESEPSGNQVYAGLGHAVMPYAQPHVSGGGEDLDLKKLWDMLTESMSSSEKKAYAQQFVAIVQQHQERMALREATETKVLLVKLALVLAAIGVVTYIIYAVISANHQETERGRQRAKVDKIVAQTAPAQAAAAAANPTQATAPLKADIDELKKQMAGVDTKIKAEVERVQAEVERVRTENEKGINSACDLAKEMNNSVKASIDGVRRDFVKHVDQTAEMLKQSRDATNKVDERMSQLDDRTGRAFAVLAGAYLAEVITRR